MSFKLWIRQLYNFSMKAYLLLITVVLLYTRLSVDNTLTFVKETVCQDARKTKWFSCQFFMTMSRLFREALAYMSIKESI